MHLPAGERKQTGRAKENKFYSKKTFDETYYMITHSTHEMTEVLVLVPVLYQYQSAVVSHGGWTFFLEFRHFICFSGSVSLLLLLLRCRSLRKSQ